MLKVTVAGSKRQNILAGLTSLGLDLHVDAELSLN